MGTIILIIAFVIEGAFAAYCIVTKANQRQVRNYLRLGALAAFVLLALAAVIQWGLRWYLLAALLFIWAGLGALALLRKKTGGSAYRPGRSITRAVGTLLLVAIAVTPALILPQYKLPPVTGAHPVATATYSYTDPSRPEIFSKTGGNREVNVAFWYPQDGGGPYPLVVFSHGAFGVKASNTSTFLELASHGYVVCSIDHPYHSFYTVDAAGRRTIIDQAYLQEFLAVNSGKYDDATELKLEQQWVSLRAADINFVLDTILQQAQQAGSDAVYQNVDPQKIGLMGHSLGGESSAQVARLRAAGGRNDIDAVINLDADLAGEYLGLQDGKPVINPEVYPVPILTIFSDTLARLIEAIPNANEVVAVKHVTTTAPDAFEIHLAGTDHMSLTDLPLVSPFLVSLINSSVPKAGGAEVDPYGTLVKMNGIILQFFNVYLKGDGAFTSAGFE
jgi:dienelactone hydrolase